MMVRKLRLENGGSQEQLAQFSGLSVRTIQRIERGRQAGSESLKSLAAVFNTNITTLSQEPDMSTTEITAREQQVLTQVRDIKGFYNHAVQYVAVTGNKCLYLARLLVGVLAGGGLGIRCGHSWIECIHLFGPQWERRQVEKRLNKNGD